jgi:chaperone modulatory protein CbpM
VRARRIAHLETTFDADPHLAALAADLMEEVAALRQRLAQLEPPSAQAH